MRPAIPGLQTARAAAVVAVALAAAVVAGPVSSTASAQAFPEQIPLPDGFQPEGIAVGAGHTFYVGSIPTGDIYSGDLRTGAGDILVDAPEGRAAIGLDVDGRGRLFVAGGPTGDGYVYDARTGEPLAAYDFAGADTFVNDVVVTQDGAWFTDSFQPVLYFVPFGPGGSLPDPSDFETLPLSGDFEQVQGFNLNGIDATPDGGTLVVVQSATGLLFRVDSATGETDEIELAGGEAVPAGDGILLDGKTLYVVQNQLNQVARIDLAPDLGSGTVVSRTSDPGFDVPTTVAEFGNRLYLVNARFGTTPTPDTEYNVTQVPKP